MNNNHYCVIMAGGSSSQFWPVSRENMPKEFLALGGPPLLRTTYDRFAAVVPKENILVVTLERYKEGAEAILPELPKENLLLEPYSRQTAPCMTYAVYTILKRNPDAVIVATPSDHVISEQEKFREVVLAAMDHAAREDVLMTIGIVPESPSADFGYIQVTGGRHLDETRPIKVKTFTEKPSEELAKVFLRSGEFYWNSGIYIWSAKTVRRELEEHVPEVTRLFAGWEEHIGTPDEAAFIEKAYADCPKLSLDYGVLEKTDNAWLYPARFGWSDIGDWDRFFAFGGKNEDGNLAYAGKALLENTRGTIVATAKEGKLIALSGLRDYLVVDTNDVLLICPRDARSIKEITSRIAMPEFEKYR